MHFFSDEEIEQLKNSPNYPVEKFPYKIGDCTLDFPNKGVGLKGRELCKSCMYLHRCTDYPLVCSHFQAQICMLEDIGFFKIPCEDFEDCQICANCENFVLLPDKFTYVCLKNKVKTTFKWVNCTCEDYSYSPCIEHIYTESYRIKLRDEIMNNPYRYMNKFTASFLLTLIGDEDEE